MTTEVSDKTASTSKSQRKREATALQDLGAELTRYSSKQLQQLPITDAVIAAIEEYNRLPHSHGARRRQLQFIGRLMRDCDYNELSQAVSKLEHTSPTTNGNSDTPSSTDQWLARIDSKGVSAIENLLTEYPAADRQKLRQLHRNLEKSSGPKKTAQLQKLRSYLTSLITNESE